MKVLVAEKIGESGIALLRERLDVELGAGWDREELAQRIGEFDGLLIRSATRVDASLIERAARLKVIGRAGVGVDNVDVAAATKRGVLVANAPQSNVVTTAEHTMALLLALARNVPQAHASLKAGRWERSRFSGVELSDKTLGILGFGRVGQRVAQRAMGFGMRVVAFDPYVGAERFREMGVERAESSDQVYARAHFLTLHLPGTAQTDGWLDAEALAKCRDGVRILNVARGKLIVDADLEAALRSGKVAGVALDVFQSEPITEHPLFGFDNVIVTPHLGASTVEATDRAGYQAAEQVLAALTGGVVSTAVNAPSVAPEDMEVLGPFLPLARRLGRIAMGLAEPAAVESVEIEIIGRLAERDTHPLAVAALMGVLAGHTEEDVNAVNAPALAEERGISLSHTTRTGGRDFTDLVRVAVVTSERRNRVAGTTLGRRHRPHLVEAWGQRFNIQIEDDTVALFRYRDKPGMIGLVGTCFGNHGVNINSAAVGHVDEIAGDGGVAVMVITTNASVPPAVIDAILATDGFLDGRSVALLPADGLS